MIDLNAALMSPGFAMADTAINNLYRMQLGQPAQSPVQAYQQTVQNQALLQQRQKAAEQLQQQRNPFYEYEQALARNYIPAGTTYQQYMSDYKGAAGKTIDERNLETYQRMVSEATTPEEMEAAERFAMASNLTLTGREPGGLSSTDSSRLSEATTNARQMAAQANRFDMLANSFAQSDLNAGVPGQVEEWFKRMVGGEDEQSELRRQQREIVNTDVINNLPPGVASDRDIQIAREGYPTNFADKDYVAAYFRGVAKIRRLEADFERFTANYISDEGNQRGMLRAWEDYAQQKYGGYGGQEVPDDAPVDFTYNPETGRLE